MADRSKIEWTDATWNPIRARHRKTGKVGWHCEKISPACTHCYAAAQNKQGLRGGTKEDYTAAAAVDVFLDEATLQKPLHWKRPRRIFVCSMTDLFGSWVTVEMLDRIYDVMAACPQHTFQVLTKRPERMRRYHWNLAKRIAYIPDNLVRFPLPNLWAGVTIESQDYTSRLEELLETPAAIRFVSVEPLLAPLDLGLRNWADLERSDCRLDWVIVGGESGRQRTVRPTHPDWVRLIRDDCQAADVPFFFKQWGEWLPADGGGKILSLESRRINDAGQDITSVPELWCGDEKMTDAYVYRVGKKKSGRMLDGMQWNEFPTAPEAAPCST